MTYRIKNTPIVVSGHFDVVDDDMVIEFKTVASTKYVSKPHWQHVMQANFYAYCEGLEKILLVYVDLSSVKTFPLQVNPSLIEILENRAIDLHRAVLDDVPPRTGVVEDWECRLCDFAEECEESK